MILLRHLKPNFKKGLTAVMIVTATAQLYWTVQSWAPFVKSAVKFSEGFGNSSETQKGNKSYERHGDS